MSFDRQEKTEDEATAPRWTFASRTLAALAVALALYLYLGRLDGTPLQRGNEAMYASMWGSTIILLRYEGMPVSPTLSGEKNDTMHS